MILDNYLSYQQKIIIAMISGAIWIYFRTFDYYALLKRKQILSVFLVSSWIYVNYYEPLALPIGLMIMTLYAYYMNKKTN